MMKRIVICCDGTWNVPDKIEDGRPCATNVVKIAEAVKSVADDNVHQIIYYHPGVGTSGSAIQQWFDGATGSGISEDILEAYRFLIAHYELGDHLYFFGFSRGAFTVRSLAGLIRNSGLLRRNATDMIHRAYKIYKSRNVLTHPQGREATLFRKTYAVADTILIKFIGVWDTVGSLGNPLFVNTILSKLSFSILRNQFHDTDLSSYVENAFQALAIDEKRRNFIPAIWHQQTRPLKRSQHQELQQAWFVGVHSNIGGGYPSTGLSDIALDWMAGKARDCKLDLETIPLQSNTVLVPVESWKFPYTLIPRYYRPIGISENANELLHPSVIEFYRNNKNYRPKNLEAYFNGHSNLKPTNI